MRAFLPSAASAALLWIASMPAAAAPQSIGERTRQLRESSANKKWVQCDVAGCPWAYLASPSEMSATLQAKREHMTRYHRSSSSAGGGGGTDALNRLAAEAFSRGYYKEGFQAMGASILTQVSQSLFSSLFSGSSGPSAADIEAERRWREEAERQRLEQLRIERIAAAAQMRETLNLRDVERTNLFEGVFDVARPRGTAFFGIEANPEVEAEAPPEVPPAEPPAAPPVEMSALSSLEASLRDSGVLSDSSVVVLDEGALNRGVSPAFLRDQATRAYDSRTFFEQQTRWKETPPGPRDPWWDRYPRAGAAADIVLMMGKDFYGWGRDKYFENIGLPGLADTARIQEAENGLIEQLFKDLQEKLDLRQPDVAFWDTAFLNYGKNLVRDLWGDPMRWIEGYGEKFEILIHGRPKP